MKIVASSDTNASTWGAGLADAGKALSAEIAASRADLERLDALLADAIATLVESFGALSVLCRARRRRRRSPKAARGSPHARG